MLELFTDPLTLLARATPPYALVGERLRVQPIVKLLDVNGSLVTVQQASVQVAIDEEAEAEGGGNGGGMGNGVGDGMGSGADEPVDLPPLYGGTLVDSYDGVASFLDVTVGGPRRGVRLRVSSPGLIDAVSEPFDVVVPGEPIALAVHGAPGTTRDGLARPEVVQRDVPLVTHNISAEIVDGHGVRVVDAPTMLVHLCVRAVGDVVPCAPGAPQLLASVTAFAGYPGGFARFPHVSISAAACVAAGAPSCRNLFFEAVAAGLQPGRTTPTADVLPAGISAKLGFAAQPDAATSPYALPSSGMAPPPPAHEPPRPPAWLEGVSLAVQPTVNVLDSAGARMPLSGYVTIDLEMLSLDYTNDTTWSPPPPPPPLTPPPSLPPPSEPPPEPPSAPPSAPPIAPPPSLPPNTTNATNATEIVPLLSNATANTTNTTNATELSLNATLSTGTNATNATNATDANQTALEPPTPPEGPSPPGEPPLPPATPNGTNATDLFLNLTNTSNATYYDEGPGPLYALLGNTTAPLVDGVATFSGLSIRFRRFYLGVLGPRGGVFRFVAHMAGLHEAASANFSVLMPTVPCVAPPNAPSASQMPLPSTSQMPLPSSSQMPLPDKIPDAAAILMMTHASAR